MVQIGVFALLWFNFCDVLHHGNHGVSRMFPETGHFSASARALAWNLLYFALSFGARRLYVAPMQDSVAD